MPRSPWWRSLYAQVLAAIFVGGALGHFAPELAVQLKPLGDAFIKLVKMVIGPVIFLTVAGGIAGMSALGQLGSTTGKAMLYFITVSTFAMSSRVIIWNVLGKVGCSLILEFEPKMDYTRLLQSCAKHCESDVSDFMYGEVVEFFVL